MAIKLILVTQRMTEVWAAKFTSFLSFHRRYEHSIIIHQYQFAILTHKYIVRFQISMTKRLRKEECTHSTEPIGQHLQSITIIYVLTQICIQRLSFHPFHLQNREFFLLRLSGINKQFIL